MGKAKDKLGTCSTACAHTAVTGHKATVIILKMDYGHEINYSDKLYESFYFSKRKSVLCPLLLLCIIVCVYLCVCVRVPMWIYEARGQP